MKELIELKESLEEAKDSCVINVCLIKSKRGEFTPEDMQLQRFYEGKVRAFEDVIDMIEERLSSQKEKKK